MTGTVSAPALAGTLTNTSLERCVGLAYYDGHVYTGATQNPVGVVVVDVSTPDAPTLGTTVSTTYPVVDVCVTGDHLYVLTGNSFSASLLAFDLTDPANPTQVGSVGGFKAPTKIAAGTTPGRLWLAATDGFKGPTLWLVDISNPTTPTLGASALAGSSDVMALAAGGDHAYVVFDGTYDRFYIYDDTLTTSVPAFGASNLSGDQIGYGTPGGISAVFAGDGTQLSWWDVSNPSASVPHHTIPSPDGSAVRPVAVDGQWVYAGLASGPGKFVIWDGSTPSTLLSGVTVGGDNAIVVSGDYAYLLNGNLQGSLYVIEAARNQPPNAPDLTFPVGNQTIDSGTTNRFAWTFSDPNVGDTQSEFTLRYRVTGTSTWTTVAQSTPNQYWDAAAGTFADGTYEWQVKTKDSQGVEGPFSSSEFFTVATAPTAPTILTPANNGSVAGTVDLEWSTPDQDAYQVQVLDAGGTTLDDTGELVSTARARTITFDTNNVVRVLRVRVKADGLWSPWSAVTVTVSFTPPQTPVVALSQSQSDVYYGTLTVTISNPEPAEGEPDVDHNEVWIGGAYSNIDGAVVLGEPNAPGAERRALVPLELGRTEVWTYWTPVSGVQYAQTNASSHLLPNLYVIAVGTNGTRSTPGFATDDA